MLKQVPLKHGDEPCITITKRPRTDDLCKATNARGHFVQIFDHKKPWSLASHPWQLVGPKVFHVKISEEHMTGLNICVSDGEHYEVTPYAPAGTTCTDRDGCGGPVRLGDTLQWKCNHLLHLESGPVSADVMVVFLDIERPVDGMLYIERIVRGMFHVDGDFDTTEPCWKVGSVEQNQRDYWRHNADAYSKQTLQLKLEYQSMKQLMQTEMSAMQQQMQAEIDRTQQQLQVYKDAIEAITLVAKCPICRGLMSDKKPGMVASCGHFACAGCHEDYYHAIGVYEDPVCSVCQRLVGRKENWQKFFAMTGVVTAIKQTITVEHVD